MQDDQLSETQLTELRNHLQPYENDANKAAALQQTKRLLVEKNLGSTFIAHKFFPGISCATELLAEIRMKLTSEHGAQYYYHLSNYYHTIADITIANEALGNKVYYMKAASTELDRLTVLMERIPDALGHQICFDDDTKKYKNIVGSIEFQAKVLLGHLVTQLQYRKELRSAIRPYVKEDKISKLQ